MSAAKRHKPGERSPREKRIACQAKANERARCIRIVWALQKEMGPQHLSEDARRWLIDRFLQRTTHPRKET